ncbi:MAG: hypothetical protein OXU61_06930 [Gammaproteobacteria bacterium]|nr:hypothetical protein [Gammaproteobacteria bacterium]
MLAATAQVQRHGGGGERWRAGGGALRIPLRRPAAMPGWRR